MLTTDPNAVQSAEEVRECAQSRVEHQNRSLDQINPCVSLPDLFQKLGRPATMDDLHSELHRLADRGFDWLWFLGMWQMGAAARKISRKNPEWLAEFRQVRPDPQPDDKRSGSCLVVTGYTTHSDFGADAALERLRHRIHQGGMCLVDFVPDHTEPDHPEFYVAAWDGNWAWGCFIIFAWQKPCSSPLLVVVNYAPDHSQCVWLPFEQIRGQKVRLHDLMGSAMYQQGGNNLLYEGHYLDLPAWGYQRFEGGTV
jgi:hypothetical protein